jgi:hypothetical protein
MVKRRMTALDLCTSSDVKVTKARLAPSLPGCQMSLGTMTVILYCAAFTTAAPRCLGLCPASFKRLPAELTETMQDFNHFDSITSLKQSWLYSRYS